MLSKTIATASVAALALALSGCSSTGSDSGIAKLGDAKTDPTAAATPAGSAEDQALAFAQCMRDNGVDFPDPTVDADGNPSFAGAFDRSASGGFDPSDTTFQEAMTACGDLAEGLQMGMGGGGSFDQEAISEALYSYTQCLRDEGLDVGDITLDSMMPGGGRQGTPDADAQGTAGTPPSPAAGDGAQPTIAPGERGPGGNMTDRFAEQLGQDTTDPAWIAANETCQPVLEDAMTAAGVGGQGAGA
ncbi:MAG: hypothetical protein HGA51_03840 [Demequinaceae bacterium]|nr:hypothetical protein [Demequinaceae bacterium]